MNSQVTTLQPIYHYTKIDAGLNILCKKKLRLNKIGKTNDPRESRPWEFPNLQFFGSHANSDHVKAINDANDVIRDIIPKVVLDEWKVLCFTLDGSSRVEQTDALFAAYLNPGYARPRMWAQYAENHKGICLVFDRDELNNKLQEKFGKQCFHGKVNYDGITFVGLSLMTPLISDIDIPNDIKNRGPNEAAQEFVIRHYQSFFLVKNPDWTDESEYRWLVHNQSNEFEEVSIEGAVKGVLIGMDFPEIYGPSLITFCKELGIWAKRMKWHNGLPVPEANFEIIYDPVTNN